MSSSGLCCVKDYLSQVSPHLKVAKVCCTLLIHSIVSLLTKGFPDGSVVKNPAKQEMQGQCLGREDLLDKERATHAVLLPGESHGQRSLAGCSPWGRKSWTQLSTHPPMQETLE